MSELIEEVSLTADNGSDELKKRLNDRIVELSSGLTDGREHLSPGGSTVCPQVRY